MNKILDIDFLIADSKIVNLVTAKEIQKKFA